MTQAHFTRDDTGRILSFCATGHSGYAASGEDVVCAAISALLQAAVFTLETLYPPAPEYRIAPGSLSCTLSKVKREQRSEAEVQAILRHTLLALMNIALAAPQHFTLTISDITDWSVAFAGEDAAKAVQRMLTKE